MSKILIIEDDVDIQKIYHDKLAHYGYEVFSAFDGNQGLMLAKSVKPDLILLDIILPKGLNGFEVLKELQASKDLKSIPVIVLTNIDTEKQVAMEMGVRDYLIKANITPKQVVERIKNYIDKKLVV